MVKKTKKQNIKVKCEDCKYLGLYGYGYDPSIQCENKICFKKIYDPIEGKNILKRIFDFQKLNKNGNCKYYKKDAKKTGKVRKMKQDAERVSAILGDYV